MSVDLPKKHGRGGQSALRFARLRMEKRHNYVRKVAELAVQVGGPLYRCCVPHRWRVGSRAEVVVTSRGEGAATLSIPHSLKRCAAAVPGHIAPGALPARTRYHRPLTSTPRLVSSPARLQFFITNDRPNVAGLVLAGSADFKTELSQSDMFDPRLQAVVLAVVDVSYGERLCSLGGVGMWQRDGGGACVVR